jgi:hypothetical protein
MPKPPLPKHLLRRIEIRLVCNEAEYATIKKAATQKDQYMSQWIRDAIAEKIVRERGGHISGKPGELPLVG